MFKRWRMWAVLVAILVIAGIHGGLASAVSNLAARGFLKQDAATSQQFLADILAAEDQPEALFAQPSPSPTLTSFAAHVRQLPGVVRANIYSPDLFIRHSTEPNLVGVQFKDNAELTESFEGQLVAKFVDNAEAGKEEHIALGGNGGSRLIEAYIPVPDAQKRIVAVVEFYRRDENVSATLANLTRLVWLAALANGLVLLVVVWLFRRRATAS